MTHHQWNILPPGKDPIMWQRAQRRVSFRQHFTTYLVVIAFFWLIWFITSGSSHDPGLPWPCWPMFGWGIGVVFHYLAAYGQYPNVEKEYEKLTNNHTKS